MTVNRTDNANAAPRCGHAKLNGEPCRAPAMRGQQFCVFHTEIRRSRPHHHIPFVEDAITLQVALMEILRALLDDTIEPKKAALMLYALQIACTNLKRFAEELNHEQVEEEKSSPSLAEYLLEKLQQAAERRAREAAEYKDPLRQAG